MRKFLGASAVAAAIAASAPANATTYFMYFQPDTTQSFSKSTSWFAGFTNNYVINLPESGFLTALIESYASSPNLDVSLRKVTFDGILIPKLSSGVLDSWGFEDYAVSAGKHVLGVTGYWGKNGGTYTGKVSFNLQAVPEPAAWAMMIAGFGLVGASMHRRSKVAVSYS